MRVIVIMGRDNLIGRIFIMKDLRYVNLSFKIISILYEKRFVGRFVNLGFKKKF